jgi:hypothetical protein
MRKESAVVLNGLQFGVELGISNYTDGQLAAFSYQRPEHDPKSRAASDGNIAERQVYEAFGSAARHVSALSSL